MDRGAGERGVARSLAGDSGRRPLQEMRARAGRAGAGPGASACPCPLAPADAASLRGAGVANVPPPPCNVLLLCPTVSALLPMLSGLSTGSDVVSLLLLTICPRKGKFLESSAGAQHPATGPECMGSV